MNSSTKNMPIDRTPNTGILSLTDGDFETHVLNRESPILVDFWAPWCGPCRMLSPILEAVAGELAGKLTIGKVNVDENPMIAQALGIQAIPTMLLFNEGQIIKVITGFHSKQDILNTIQASISL